MGMDAAGVALVRAITLDARQPRLLRLQGLHETWVVERFEGTESVCGDNRLQIDCLATDAFLELES
ncbi:MAG: hypothetical protein KH046_18970, partial [Stenotrophomonas maltophilia]|nr:hypothetical protein [Stenotrophomonas maltophilia]